MRKFAGAVAVAAFLALCGSAQATCGVSCLNHKVKSLTTALHKAERLINNNAAVFNRFVSCVGESALTLYGDPSGHTFGYVYDPGPTGPGTFDTGAIAPTQVGTPVDEWGLFDTCNKSSSPSLRRGQIARGSGPVAAEESPFTAGALAFP
jgi:hypothetical protein